MDQRTVIRSILIGFGFMILVLFGLWQTSALFLSTTGEVGSSSDSPLVALMQVPSPTVGIPNSVYVGWEYPPLPDGLRQSAFSSVATVGGNKISISQVISMDTKMLWMLRSEYDEDGSERWVIMDVLDMNQLEEGEGVLWNSCRFQDRLIKNVVVIGPMVNNRISQPRVAWLADAASGKFKPMQPVGFTCDLVEMGR